MRKRGRPENKKRNGEIISLLRKLRSYTKVAEEVGTTRQAIEDIARRKGFVLKRSLARSEKISLDNAR